MYKVSASHMLKTTLLLTGFGLPKRVKICIDLDAVTSSASKAAKSLQAAAEKMRSLDEWSDSAFEEYKRALEGSFIVLFGAKATKQIIDYFDGQYISMSKAITPFINDVVVPAMQSGAAKAERK